MEFRCVQCGFPVKKLYIQYSPGNIRLLKCENCNAIADDYIECEIMILVIDMVLHKPQAYRHLFFNVFNREVLSFEGFLWKLTIAFLFLDVYRIMILNRGEEKCGFSASLSSNLCGCGEVCTCAIFGNLIFLSMLLLGTKGLLRGAVRPCWYKNVWVAVLTSSYLKIFLIFMMVWEFPPLVIFIIDVFILSSNTVAIKVVTESSMVRCFWVCFAAHAAKFIGSGGFSIPPSKLVI